MQISRVNSVNFKGLWEKSKERYLGKKHRSHVFVCDSVYHPFKDETQEEIDATFKEGRKSIYLSRSKHESPYWSIDGPDSFIVVKESLGNRLSITKEQYSELEKLDEVSGPLSDKRRECTWIFSPHSDTKKILDEVE